MPGTRALTQLFESTNACSNRSMASAPQAMDPLSREVFSGLPKTRAPTGDSPSRTRVCDQK